MYRDHKPIRLSRAAAKRHSANMTGKNIVITGATAGVGKKTARSLATMGGNINFATRNRDKTQGVIDEVRAERANGAVLEHKQLDLNDIRCTCASLHFGGVRTRIFDTYGAALKAVMPLLWPVLVEPPEGARTSVYLATRARPEEIGGKYFYYGMFHKGIYEKQGTSIVNDEAPADQPPVSDEGLSLEQILGMFLSKGRVEDIGGHLRVTGHRKQLKR